MISNVSLSLIFWVFCIDCKFLVLLMAKRILRIFRVYLKWLIFMTQQFSLTTQCKLCFVHIFFKTVNLLQSTDRMPPQIGDFISTAVYNDQLQFKSFHPITDKVIACHLIDVSHGIQQSYETSFKVCNPSIFLIGFFMVIMLPRILQRLRLPCKLLSNSRFKARISGLLLPYDVQRSALEEGMKEHGWLER